MGDNTNITLFFENQSLFRTLCAPLPPLHRFGLLALPHRLSAPPPLRPDGFFRQDSLQNLRQAHRPRSKAENVPVAGLQTRHRRIHRPETHKVRLMLIGGLPGRGCINQKAALPFPEEQNATDSQPDDAVIREKHSNIYPYYVPPFCIRTEVEEPEAVQNQ
jgi:hypothetical protein